MQHSSIAIQKCKKKSDEQSRKNKRTFKAEFVSSSSMRSVWESTEQSSEDVAGSWGGFRRGPECN